MTAKTHRTIIASIFFGFGLVNLLGWIAVGGWKLGIWLFLCVAILHIVAGIKIHNQTRGAKVFGVIASVVFIPSFPVGTAIGIYCLWVLLMRDRN